MARNKVDPCIFCAVAPCECGKPAAKPKKAATPKASKPETVAAPAPAPEKVFVPVKKVSAVAAMKARAKPIERATVDVPLPPMPTEARAEEDAQFASAVRALAPVLHKTELAKYSRILAAPPTLEERREAWKARVRR